MSGRMRSRASRTKAVQAEQNGLFVVREHKVSISVLSLSSYTYACSTHADSGRLGTGCALLQHVGSF